MKLFRSPIKRRNFAEVEVEAGGIHDHCAIGSAGPGLRRMEFRTEKDRFIIKLTDREVLRLITASRGGDIMEKLTPEEFAQWMRLSKKVLGG